MAIVRDPGAGEWWAACDACRALFQGGRTVVRYVPLSRLLAAAGWEQLPYLGAYCPADRLTPSQAST